MSLKKAANVFSALRKAELESKTKTATALAKLRKRLEAGETTGDRIRDYCLYYHDRDAAEFLGGQLVGIDAQLRKHPRELVLAVEYHAKSMPLECTWRLGLLDGLGFRFRPADRKTPDRPPIDVGVTIVADERRSYPITMTSILKDPPFIWESLYPLLVDGFLQATYMKKRPKEDSSARANLIIGNAAVIAWFKKDVPYNIFYNNAQTNLARAVLNLGQAIMGIQPLQEWLQETRADCVSNLNYSVEECLRALENVLYTNVRDEDSKDDADGGCHLHEHIPSAFELVTKLRDVHKTLNVHIEMARGIGVEETIAWKHANNVDALLGRSFVRAIESVGTG